MSKIREFKLCDDGRCSQTVKHARGIFCKIDQTATAENIARRAAAPIQSY
jgi:hypothetical protein